MKRKMTNATPEVPKSSISFPIVAVLRDGELEKIKNTKVAGCCRNASESKKINHVSHLGHGTFMTTLIHSNLIKKKN